MEGIVSIQTAFARHFTEGKMEPWKSTVQGGRTCIDVSNRLFTHVRDAHPDSIMPFPARHDPKGHISKMIDSTFVHTTENAVQYYKRICSSDGGIR